MYPDLGQSLYGTSKAALNHLTYHLANEFWDLGVRVNSIAPDTFPGRIPTEEVLEAILVLDTSNQTGQVVRLYREA
jgi:NAD(P)-dependent dehydrogenase (short-subunit alcohol dehydrogenase family)